MAVQVAVVGSGTSSRYGTLAELGFALTLGRTGIGIEDAGRRDGLTSGGWAGASAWAAPL